MNLKLAKEHRGSVFCFLGVHPSEVSEKDPLGPGPSIVPFLPEADGIGEIGLDPKYSSTSLQMKAFQDLLLEAERLGKPVEVHSRGASKLCLDALGSFRLRSVLMHWFEDEEVLGRVTSAGYYVSVGPAILYSKKVRRVASSVPVERLLTESDGPVSFGPLSEAAGPGLIPSVLYCLSELQRSSYEEVGWRIEENSQRFLGRPFGSKSP